MSPECWSGSEVKLTSGGCSPGAETKFLDNGPLARATAASTGALTRTGVDTPNENRMRLAPGAPDAVPAAGELSTALTVTRSRLVNRCSGMKAVPAPAGSATRRPAWAPLREPMADTDLISDGGSDEKMMSEDGEASGVPGNGITWSAGADAAAG